MRRQPACRRTLEHLAGGVEAATLISAMRVAGTGDPTNPTIEDVAGASDFACHTKSSASFAGDKPCAVSAAQSESQP